MGDRAVPHAGRGSDGDPVLRILAGAQLLVPRSRRHSLSWDRIPDQRKSGLSWFLTVGSGFGSGASSADFIRMPGAILPLFSRGVLEKSPASYLRLQRRSLLGGTVIFYFLL